MGEIRGEGLLCRRGSFTLDIESLEIPHGQKIALLGENGCGKTTLLHILAGLLPLEQGRLMYKNMPWDKMNPRQRSLHMSYLPQEADVLFNLTVEELIVLTLDTAAPAREEREQILEATEMKEYLERIYPSLSGGEKRRAMLARVLMRGRVYLFLDEPTAPLDMRHSAQLMRHIAGLDACVVVAMHDLNLALRYFDRFLLMKNGKIIFDKGKQELHADILEEIYGIRLKSCGDHFIPDC